MNKALELRLNRFEELERLLTDPAVLSDTQKVKVLAKEMATLKPAVDRVREFQRIQAQLESTRQLLHSKETNPEMQALARAELEQLNQRRLALERDLEGLLLEEDPKGMKGAIVEIRAGTGGAEASLFVGDLYRMYTRFATRQSWAVEPLGLSPTEVGGFKEVIFSVEGEGVFRRLKFERGVHRVQRIPETEASGRIHTSTVTVAVLPQAGELEVQIGPKDLRVDVFRSSGPGGQSVNTADSAVRVTHIPTGLMVSCQDERSQLKNKAKAMKILRARLLALKTSQAQAQRTQERRAQIGTGDRSEKVRTYNFHDRRITDHRVNFTSHRLEQVLNGELEELIDPLLEAERQTTLGSSER